MGALTSMPYLNDVDPNIIIDPVLDRAETAQDYAEEIQDLARQAIQDLIDNAKTALEVDDIFTQIAEDLFNIDASGLSGVNPSKPQAQEVNIPTIGLPSVVLPPKPEIIDYLDQILTTLIERENAVWERAISRQQTENEAAYNEALNFWSSRGFSMPPGMLNATIIEARNRNDQKLLDINNDILVKSGDLEQQNAQFNATMRIEYKKLEIEVFQAILNQYKEEVALIIATAEGKIRIEELKVNIFKSQMDAYATEVDVLIKIFLGNVDKAKAEADVLIKGQEVALQKLLAEKELTNNQMEALLRVAGQLGAAALTSISSSTSLGISKSYNTSEGYSESNSFSESQSTSYSESHNHFYQHDAE